MPMLSSPDSRPCRAADGDMAIVIRKIRPLFHQQSLEIRHILQRIQMQILIISENEEDVRLRTPLCRRCCETDVSKECYDDAQGEVNQKPHHVCSAVKQNKVNENSHLQSIESHQSRCRKHI